MSSRKISRKQTRRRTVSNIQKKEDSDGSVVPIGTNMREIAVIERWKNLTMRMMVKDNM